MARETADGREHAYVVDDLVVDTAQRVISRNGKEIPVGKLTFDLLQLLIEQSPGIVTREVAADRLWNRRHVSQETVRQRVKLLRKALDDDPATPRYVKVIRGQGYRLIPAIRVSDGSAKPAMHRRYQVLAAAAMLVTVCLAILTSSGIRDSDAIQVTGGTAGNSIAVLPFENLSGNSADSVFLDGLHNDLLTRLAKQQYLDVNSRASVLGYRSTRKSSRKIGEELSVATILEGSIQRSGNVIRINVQLVDAHTEKHLWAEIYDRQLNRQDLFSLQNELAAEIAAALNQRLAVARDITAKSLSNT